VLAACLTCAAFLALHLAAERRGVAWLRALGKLGASGSFVALAGSLRPHDRFGLAVLAALVLSLLGDALLLSARKPAFLAGLVAFLLAHVAYVVAFAPLSRPSPLVLAANLAVTAGVVRWLWPHAGELRVPVLAYAAVIAAMLWLALGVPRGAIQAGAALFWLSDLTVARDRFVRESFANRLVGLPLYYAGQLLLASTVG
jgi:uncharacterized membrane protein YhhN